MFLYIIYLNKAVIQKFKGEILGLVFLKVYLDYHIIIIWGLSLESSKKIRGTLL